MNNPAAPIVFALSPAMVQMGVLDYAAPQSQKIYHMATSAISKDTLYHCESLTLRSFLTGIKARARANGWDTILEIPEDINDPHINLKNILESYGERSLEDIEAHALTYLGGNNRASQD